MRFLSLSILLLSLTLACSTKPEGAAGPGTAPALQRVSERTGLKSCVNLNTATAEQLKELPGIGEVMSRRIIEYRERNGPLGRPEEVIIIEGFSERKYRAIAHLICVQ